MSEREAQADADARHRNLHPADARGNPPARGDRPAGHRDWRRSDTPRAREVGEGREEGRAARGSGTDRVGGGSGADLLADAAAQDSFLFREEPEGAAIARLEGDEPIEFPVDSFRFAGPDLSRPSRQAELGRPCAAYRGAGAGRGSASVLPGDPAEGENAP